MGHSEKTVQDLWLKVKMCKNLLIHMINAGVITKQEYTDTQMVWASCKRMYGLMLANGVGIYDFFHQKEYYESAWGEYLLAVETLIQKKNYELWFYYEKPKWEEFHKKNKR